MEILLIFIFVFHSGFRPRSSFSLSFLAIPTMIVKVIIIFMKEDDFYIPLFTKSAVCIDPIIYFGLNPQFRSEMVKSLRKLGALLTMPKR